MSDLEEKFVADDGVSSVPDAVTPEGGEIKKKKADVKPAPEKAQTLQEPKMEETEEASDSEVEVIEEEIISIEESIAGMFEGMDLSEDFKSKVSLVFEAAVNEATKTRVDEAVATLEEEFEAKLEESVNSSVDEIVDNLDSYLDYVVGEWMEENEVAIESGIKVEMAESLMDGLKDLFHGHNVEINEETIDVVADLEEKVATLEEKANDTINENISLANEISALKAEKVFEEVSEGLTVSQKERFKTLSEKLDNENLDEYKVDLNTLKESFFKTKKIHAISEEVEEDEIITEEVETTKTTASPYSTVNAYAAALSKNSK